MRDWPRYQAKCWRCHTVFTPHGICCAACRPALLAEGEAQRVAAGGVLFLPADDTPPLAVPPVWSGFEGEDMWQQNEKAKAWYRNHREPRSRPETESWWSADPVACGMSARDV